MEQVSQDTVSRPRLAFWRNGLTFWSSAADAPRHRRPTDVGLAVAGLVAMALLAIAAPGPTDVDAAVAKTVASFPGLLTWLWESVYAAALLWALVLVLAATGLALALALAKASEGELRIALVDRTWPPSAVRSDVRAYAFSAASRHAVILVL